MAAMAVTHTTHAMYKSFAGFTTARSTTHTLHRARVAPTNTSGALAMDTAFAMNALSMQRGLVRPVRITHDSAEVEPVVVRNFTPTFPRLVHRYDVVEALARCISPSVHSLIHHNRAPSTPSRLATYQRELRFHRRSSSTPLHEKKRRQIVGRTLL